MGAVFGWLVLELSGCIGWVGGHGLGRGKGRACGSGIIYGLPLYLWMGYSAFAWRGMDGYIFWKHISRCSGILLA